jgi:hypothetical protein
MVVEVEKNRCNKEEVAWAFSTRATSMTCKKLQREPSKSFKGRRGVRTVKDKVMKSRRGGGKNRVPRGRQ